jgi:hypothetical protein
MRTLRHYAVCDLRMDGIARAGNLNAIVKGVTQEIAAIRTCALPDDRS